MPLRLRKRKAKRREEYLLDRDYELESSRVRYDADHDAEQRRASARDIYHCAKRLLYDSVYLCVYLRNAQNITCVVYLKCTTAYI